MNILGDVVCLSVYRKQCLLVLQIEGRKHRVIAHVANNAYSNNAVGNVHSVGSHGAIAIFYRNEWVVLHKSSSIVNIYSEYHTNHLL